MAQLHACLDRDHDGVLSLTEFVNGLRPDGQNFAVQEHLGDTAFGSLMLTGSPVKSQISGMADSSVNDFQAVSRFFFATPQLIGGGRVTMISNLVYQLGFASFNFPFAAALSLAAIVLTVALLALLRWSQRSLDRLAVHA